MEERVVVLTGVSGGIGKACVKILLENGFRVIGVDILDSDIKSDNYLHLVADLTKEDQRCKLIENIYNKEKHLDAIINLAGIFMMESIIEGSATDLEKIIAVNFYSSYYLNKGLFSLLDERSMIINMSSEIAIYSPQPFMGYYAISKKMVDAYTDVLRRECNYLGIKVVKIQSGSMKTKMLSRADDEYQKMVKETKYFEKPLAKMKYMMDRELVKNADPALVGKLILKILNKKNPKIRYRIKNSASLKFLNLFSEKTQDNIYKKVIK